MMPAVAFMANRKPKTVHGAANRLLLGIFLAVTAGCSDQPAVVVEKPFERESVPVPSDNLIVFVGRKISVEEFEPETEEGYMLMDLAFLARYEVVSVLRGEYGGENMEFEAYDHYGFPNFADYETVVLFVSQAENGRYYHQKYQYIPVYPTASGTWAGCGDPYVREPDGHRGNIEAHDIEFDPPLVFDLRGLTQREVRERYPRPFFRRSDNDAECIKGNTLEELLEVKFDGVMGARGYTDS
jgi:hypothetical protein